MKFYMLVPVLFLFFLVLFGLVLYGLRRYAASGQPGEGALDPYACGQKDFENYVNPDYTQFFRYAFVFSVMHVLALTVTTAPKDATILPLAYIGAGILALVIIFRK